MRVPRTLFLTIALSAALSATATAQTPNGSEFRVNSYTTGYQGVPQPAMDRYGRFLVVWSGRGPGDLDGIFAQRYRSSGVPAGTQFQVNVPTPYSEYLPVAGVDGKGEFVVVWTSTEGDGSYSAILGRRFSAAGTPLASEFVVNTYTTDDQFAPSLAVNQDGSFVVAWLDYQYYPSYSYNVRARRFDASGSAVGNDFLVNDTATVGFSFPQVRSAAAGGFVVVWVGTTDYTTYDVLGKRFDAGGNALGGEFAINSVPLDAPGTFPALGSDASGTFVVAWNAYNPSTLTSDIKGRRFNALGFLGDEFTVNSYTSGQQFVPWVAMELGGNFVITWDSVGADGSGSSVRARAFDAGGSPVGGDFPVNTFTASDQSIPSVAARRPGEFLVVWQSFTQDGSDYGAFGQRFGDLIHADGFN
jgi:hypothetical protein